ncbi:unnamed protein product [Staurois parvus]|uniref:Uncharacterized protein n=1 Tax=Staurois parvus TaxID=386267 RepID=A0ABN9H594_9NEOB|nr:unnamed protein product [Staurois parvus]
MDHRIPRILRNLRLCETGPAFQQGRASLVLSAGNVSILNPVLTPIQDLTQILISIKNVTQWKSHIPVLSAGNVSILNMFLMCTKELTQGRSHFPALSAKNVFHKNPIYNYIIQHTTQARSHIPVLSARNILYKNHILSNI